jgi:hypothetical protein
MFRSTIVRIIFGVFLAIIVLGTLRYKPWRGEQLAGSIDAARERLNVGFLPVT